MDLHQRSASARRAQPLGRDGRAAQCSYGAERMNQAKRPKATRGCKCASKADKALASSNARLAREFLITFGNAKITLSQPSLRLMKLDTKKRAALPTLFCTYCPFCGKKYAD